MDQRQPRGRAVPAAVELPRPGKPAEHRRTVELMAFAIAAVKVLEEHFGFTREQSKQWFDLAIDRQKADEDKPLRPLW